MTRIESCFAKLRARGEKGFIAYLTAGDPSLSDTKDRVLRLEDVGVDIVELGIPFSDPLADGRVNQQSAMRALAGGATPEGVLDCIARIRRSSDIPLMCYTYSNPLYALGLGRTVRRAAAVGLDGLLTLDLPVEEADEYDVILRKHRVNNISLITPTSPNARIAKIVRSATGFVYCVSREGVTGMQKKLSSGALALVERTRRHTRLPIALGFGISTPAQAAAAARSADAVVVGSAIVDHFHKAPATRAGRRAAAKWVGKMVRAVKEL